MMDLRMTEHPEHPWDDLTTEELAEMIEFCREYFRGPATPLEKNDPLYNWTPREWEWKKGDWYWRDDKVNLYSQHYRPITDTIQTPKDGWIPLPLAHQWMNIIDGHISLSSPDKFHHRTYGAHARLTDDSDGHGNHRNPHYACYLAFRKVIENEASIR